MQNPKRWECFRHRE